MPPKSTFFNLPDDKRERIMDAAIEEFSSQSYSTASITRIVEQAGIAKGSFYQYFEDKKDLFMHLMTVTGKKKLEYISPVLRELEEKNVFEVIRDLYMSGFQFAKDNPKLASIADMLYKSNDIEIREIIPEDILEKGNEIFAQILTKGIERGEVDPNIDVKLVSMMIGSMNMTVTEYFLKQKKLNLNDYDELYKLFDGIFYVIENGIKKKD